MTLVRMVHPRLVEKLLRHLGAWHDPPPKPPPPTLPGPFTYQLFASNGKSAGHQRGALVIPKAGKLLKIRVLLPPLKTFECFHLFSVAPDRSNGFNSFRNLRTVTLVVACAILPTLFCRAGLVSNPAVDSYNVHVGTQTFAGLYQFTTNTLLVETAQAIQGLGSDTIKMYLGSAYPRQYHYALEANITNLLTLTRDDPSCRKVFDMPFRNIVAWAYPFANEDAAFTDGNYTPAEQADDYCELYDLTKYLLTNYNNSGKTFFLGHWEGDGYLSVNNWSTNPSPATIQAMIAWENNRQRAIDDAKAGLSFTNVNVYYYAEVNRVRDAMLNGSNNNQRAINMVIPYVTNLDCLSYSSYDAMDLDAMSLYSTLDYIKAKLPLGKANTGLGQRIWVGEYGWGGWSTDLQEPANRAYIQRLLNWGPRFILFWEIYDNEPNKNFCLIDSNGVQAASYYLHQRFINQARLQTARFNETNARLPNDAEFYGLMGPELSQPLPAPTRLTVSNLPPAVSGTSATLTGQVTQGIYGDDCAAVWLFWGTLDGGTAVGNWQSNKMLGINTNFNPAKFSATLSSLNLQTNYYFRFYVTNANGQAWAPASGTLSTQVINPGDYGSRMKISFSGYNQAEGIAHFPVLVILNDSVPRFSYNQFASTNGGDLRFTDASGSLLIPHEIDEWNKGGTSWIWVQVPQLSGTNNYIWAYWGNPLAPDPPSWSANGATWLPGYKAVWHLKQGSFPFADSTGQYPLISGSVPSSTSALIGRGVGLNGVGQYLDAGTLNLSNAFTVSAWIKIDPTANGIQTICANKKGGWNTDGFSFYVNSYQTTDHKLLFESGDGTNGTTASTVTNVVSAGVWHHVAAVVDKSAGSAWLYVDGIDQTLSGAVQADFNGNAGVNLGRFTDGSFYCKGIMDEVRFADGTRSASEIWSEWMTMAQNEIFSPFTPVTLQPVLLSMNPSGGNFLASWVASGVGLALYSATNLSVPVLWTRVTNMPALVSGQWQVLAPAQTDGIEFFRLQPK